MPAVLESLESCRKWIPRLIALWLVMPALPAQADNQFAGARYQFVAAEQALDRGDRATYESLLRSLRSYPLYPYLIYDDLRKRLVTNPATEIKHFLRDYADTPLAPRLEQAWLSYLYRNGKWQAYVDHARDNDSLDDDCKRRHALLELHHRKQALQGIEDLWLHGFSLPDSCDHALNAWADGGGISSDLAWRRISMAMGEGNVGLARYLSRYLPQSQRPLLETWYELYRKPENIADAELHDAAGRAREIAFNVTARLARQDPDQAAALWPQLVRRFDFDADQQHRLQRRIALSFAYAGNAAALDWFAKIPADSSDRYVRYWRVRAALAQQDWPAVLKWIDQLTPTEQTEDRWKYWRARALEASGKKLEAKHLYKQIAQSRSYEGFLAADRIQIPYSLDSKPLQFSQSDLHRFAARPAMQRAHELLILDRKLDARREWYAAMQHFNARELELAATLAHDWGWHDRAILTVSRARYWDDLDLRFPLPYLQTVKTRSEAVGINDAWTYAVIRRESAFNTEAHSHRGAVGLMQLLPSTARHVARTVNRRLHAVADLYKADVNIRYGTEYLRMILQRFGDHPVLATAAYNAGPYRVQSWLPTHDTVPADIWVETVPYNETREYLRNVLAYTAIYEKRMGREATPLTQRMPPVTPQAQNERDDDAE